jgi:hypothetical protein
MSSLIKIHWKKLAGTMSALAVIVPTILGANNYVAKASEVNTRFAAVDRKFKIQDLRDVKNKLITEKYFYLNLKRKYPAQSDLDDKLIELDAAIKFTNQRILGLTK